MKKIMLSAAMLAFAGMATVNASPLQTSVYVSHVQDERTPVKIEDLPDEVKTTLSGEEYAGWAPTEAFLVSPAEGDKYYEISLNKDDETKVVSFDEAGKSITVPVQENPVITPEAPTQEPVEPSTEEPVSTPTPETVPPAPGS